ncbi:DinB family protein [Micromonospora antibiotica]|uniref:DinB family protein n=1 Tax=Micromonospora antibiotica TaxID=2807623 RepID=A0ABS3VD11_9ACTN|nr:DinB family protein [Micromonospora antibiotica]MBO4163510.1 DinB family protein [Micromonospora antibiotica]
MTTSEQVLTGERADLLQAVGMHRGFLRHTVRGLTDAQAATRSTASELCLGGLIKHVTMVEDRWARFMVGGAEAMESEPVDWAGMFQMTDDDTLVDLLARYAETAARTDELITTLDLDASHPLPVAPWFEPGAAWSVRRTLLHVIGETAQHAGHADIIRESIDGAKTMG